jgi:hypothetical protein
MKMFYMSISKYKFAFHSCIALSFAILACEKTTTAPPDTGVANFTVFNGIPTSGPVIPVINTGQPIEWFGGGNRIYYSMFYQYSVLPGNDTVYAVQNADTVDVGPKTTGQIFYGILPLKKGGIYSLYLCGKDTASPDYVFTTDTLPYHGLSDSTVGIRFVNLSTGSNPISVNLEGSPDGSEVDKLEYKGISGFKNYISNSSVTYGGYLFVFRDAISGDSLTSYSLGGLGTIRYPGNGLYAPYYGNPLVFKNVTIALIGQPGATASIPQTAILVYNY